MPKKGLSTEEALSIFEDIPSDASSDISESSSEEEEIPQPLDETDILSDESDVETLNLPGSSRETESHSLPGTLSASHTCLPGPSVAAETIWTKKADARKNIPAFSQTTGPSDEILSMEDKSPLSLFLAFLSLAFMETIVFQTNMYATQKGKPYTSLDMSEFLKFLAMNLLMGIKKMPSYRDHWSSAPDLHDEYIANLMPIKRFSWILSNLHLNDNTYQPKRGDPDFDKLYKIRPFLEHLSNKFLSLYHPTHKQAVDESMIKFKGRSTLKQYMPKKPIKRGYKVWMRCNETGFASQFDIYTGKSGEVAEKNLAERVVTKFCEPIFGQNYQLFMDNFFTTYNLFKFLDTKNVYCCGTANLSRKNLPKNLETEKKLKRGEFHWAVSTDDITCLVWKDKRAVTVLSNLAEPTSIVSVERKEKNGKKISVPCPKAIADYNSNMGYVDKFDHLKSMYEVDRKSKKWWHRIFFHFIDVTTVNAYIVYKDLEDETPPKMKLKDFRRDIIIGF